MGYHRVVREQNGAREETFSRQQREPTTGHGQEVAQPVSDTPVLHRQRCLPRLSQAAIIVLLIVILVASSVLVALLTYWIAH